MFHFIVIILQLRHNDNEYYSYLFVDAVVLVGCVRVAVQIV